jgi:glucose-6-phosphate isomerase
MKFAYSHSLVSEPEILQTAERLKDYQKHLRDVVEKGGYDSDEASLNLPHDSAILDQVLAMKAKKVTPELKYIIDIGIGGSNLGTKAIYDALYGFYDGIESDRFPKIIFVDTTDPLYLERLTDFLETKISSSQEVLINAISKSGGTTETLYNLEIVLQALQPKFPDVLDRVVITTDDGSKLWNAASEKNISVLPIHKLVGGRFSVFSTVGIFPLLACGIDVTSLVNGAKDILESVEMDDTLSNLPQVSAIVQFLQYQRGHFIHDTFVFGSSLESCGKWYRQLMGESLGKEDDLDENKVSVGITPTVSIGSTDLHSVGQLYLGGPKDKMTTFVQVQTQSNLKTTDSLTFSLIPELPHKSPSDILSAILEGTKIAYASQEIPFMEIVLEGVNERELGHLLQFKMLEMMYLGRLLNVNTFDQPHVELYKIETKKILSK